MEKDYYLEHKKELLEKQKIYAKKHKKYISKWKKQYYLKNKDKVLEQRRNIQFQKKMFALNILEQNKCHICGFSKWSSSLDIHHINNNGGGKKRFIFSQDTYKNIEKYIKTNKNNLMVLCANCHRAYHFGLIKLPKPI